MNDHSFLMRKISLESLGYMEDYFDDSMEESLLSLDDEIRNMRLSVQHAFTDDDMELGNLSRTLDDEIRSLQLSLKHSFIDDDLQLTELSRSLDDEIRSLQLSLQHSFIDDVQLTELSRSLDDEIRSLHFSLQHPFIDVDLQLAELKRSLDDEIRGLHLVFTDDDDVQSRYLHDDSRIMYKALNNRLFDDDIQLKEISQSLDKDLRVISHYKKK